MRLWHRVNRRLRRWWYGDRYTAAQWPREERIAYLEEVVEYLHWQTTNQAALLRHLVGPDVHDLPAVRRTRASFDFQWADIPTGHSMLDNEEFRPEPPDMSAFTGLPPEWFKGKRVIDAGCGIGRYSWALCTTRRARALARSVRSRLAANRERLQRFPVHRVMKVDLLKTVRR